MALTVKLLAATALGTTLNTVIYSPPSGSSAMLSSIYITNQTGGPVTIHVGIRKGGGSFAYIHPSTVQIAAGAKLVFSDEITLAFPAGGSGDTFEVWAGTASSLLQCVVCGVERNI